MKTKLVLTVILTSFLFLAGCSNNEDSVEESAVASKASKSKSSVIDKTYPGVQKQVLKAFGAIATSITNGAGYGCGSDFMEQLISFHAYGDKFVEFNNGLVYDSDGNEINERTFFGTIVDKGGVKQFAAMPGTLKVAVYFGNVANLTFVSDFILKIGGLEQPPINNLITLLFVKVKGDWKMVHEHHSPVVGNEDIDIGSVVVVPCEPSSDRLNNKSYPDEEQEVLETFGAIATSITLGAGHGYDGEHMDKLISFHAYGHKFVEFNNGEVFDSADNEHNERTFFGETVDIGGVNRFAPLGESLKIAVYNGNVANLTFISDFHLEIGGVEQPPINNLITLLFVKIKGEWKMVHEHHSPYSGPA